MLRRFSVHQFHNTSLTSRMRPAWSVTEGRWPSALEKRLPALPSVAFTIGATWGVAELCPTKPGRGRGAYSRRTASPSSSAGPDIMAARALGAGKPGDAKRGPGEKRRTGTY
jgi:hypothetical protein